MPHSLKLIIKCRLYDKKWLLILRNRPRFPISSVHPPTSWTGIIHLICVKEIMGTGFWMNSLNSLQTTCPHDPLITQKGRFLLCKKNEIKSEYERNVSLDLWSLLPCYRRDARTLNKTRALRPDGNDCGRQGLAEARHTLIRVCSVPQHARRNWLQSEASRNMREGIDSALRRLKNKLKPAETKENLIFAVFPCFICFLGVLQDFVWVCYRLSYRIFRPVVWKLCKLHDAIRHQNLEY